MRYSIFAFVASLSGIITLLIIPNSYGLLTSPPVPIADYNEQKLLQQDYLWHLRKNLSVGDSYIYKICDPKTIQTSAADYHYFVQGNDPDTKKYTDSLQKTLFSFFKYAAPESQLLQIGEDWGEVTEALQPRGENTFMTVLNNNQEFSFTQNEIVRLIDKRIFPKTIEISDAFEVGYEIDIQDPVIFDEKKKKLVPIEKEDTNNVTTSFLISSQLPFPLSGESYNPVYVERPQKQFESELIVFQTKNKNIDFENPVVDEFKVPLKLHHPHLVEMSI